MVVNIVSAVVSIVSVVVLMVGGNLLRADQTLPSYQCRTAIVLDRTGSLGQTEIWSQGHNLMFLSRS